MEITPPKLYSATILQWCYFLIGMLALLWNYIGIFRNSLEFFASRNVEFQQVVLGHSFIDTYFLVLGTLCLFVSWGLVNYSRQALTLAFFTNLTILVITVVAAAIPILAVYFNSRLVDKSTLYWLLSLFYLPFFLPIFSFALVAFYFIFRNLSYIIFFGRQEAGT